MKKIKQYNDVESGWGVSLRGLRKGHRNFSGNSWPQIKDPCLVLVSSTSPWEHLYAICPRQESVTKCSSQGSVYVVLGVRGWKEGSVNIWHLHKKVLALVILWQKMLVALGEMVVEAWERPLRSFLHSQGGGVWPVHAPSWCHLHVCTHHLNFKTAQALSSPLQPLSHLSALIHYMFRHLQTLVQNWCLINTYRMKERCWLLSFCSLNWLAHSHWCIKTQLTRSSYFLAYHLQSSCSSFNSSVELSLTSPGKVGPSNLWALQNILFHPHHSPDCSRGTICYCSVMSPNLNFS